MWRDGGSCEIEIRGLGELFGTRNLAEYHQTTERMKLGGEATVNSDKQTSNLGATRRAGKWSQTQNMSRRYISKQAASILLLLDTNT